MFISDVHGTRTPMSAMGANVRRLVVHCTEWTDGKVQYGFCVLHDTKWIQDRHLLNALQTFRDRTRVDEASFLSVDQESEVNADTHYALALGDRLYLFAKSDLSVYPEVERIVTSPRMWEGVTRATDVVCYRGGCLCYEYPAVNDPPGRDPETKLPIGIEGVGGAPSRSIPSGVFLVFDNARGVECAVCDDIGMAKYFHGDEHGPFVYLSRSSLLVPPGPLDEKAQTLALLADIKLGVPSHSHGSFV
jgi:hypothetical protein